MPLSSSEFYSAPDSLSRHRRRRPVETASCESGYRRLRRDWIRYRFSVGSRRGRIPSHHRPGLRGDKQPGAAEPFDETDAAEFLPKAVAAARKLSQCNSGVDIEPQVADLAPDNVETLLADCSLIMDGTDNFETRYLINDFAVMKRLPWIYCAAVGSVGVTMNILPGETACLACMFPDSPRGALETCETSGILNAAVASIGALASAEALKFLTGAKPLMRRTLLSQDVWWTDYTEIPADTARADCICCAQHEFPHFSGENRPHITLCGRNSVQIHEQRRTIDLGELEQRLLKQGAVRRNEFALRFSREPYELTLFPDGRAIIKGTTDVTVARSFYARFVGA